MSEGGEENVVNAKRCHFINVLACNKKSDFVFFYSSAGLAVYCHSATIGPKPNYSHILIHDVCFKKLGQIAVVTHYCASYQSFFETDIT